MTDNLDEQLKKLATPENVKNEYFLYKAIKTDRLITPHKVNVPIGCDGVTYVDFEKQLDIQSEQIANRLKNGTYFFFPFREVEISKNPLINLKEARLSGEVRTLSIARLRDVLAQRLIYQVVNPYLEEFFEKLPKVSFAYRPGKSAPMAARRVYKHSKEGYMHVLDADIVKFFDKLPHDSLEEYIDRYFPNDLLISTYLKRFISTDRVPWSTYEGDIKFFNNNKGLRQSRSEGIPQGGVLSGLIANLYLHEFDAWVINELRQNFDLRYIRYADDFIIMSKKATHITQIRNSVNDKLQTVGLNLNNDKTQMIDLANHSVDFVGFSISPKNIRIQQKNIDRFKTRVDKIIRGTTLSQQNAYQSLTRMIRFKINFKVLGNEAMGIDICQYCDQPRARRNWLAFFLTATDKQQLRGIDQWLKKRIYTKYYLETGTRLSRNQLKQCGLYSLERQYYTYRNSPQENICSCSPIVTEESLYSVESVYY